MKKTSLADLQEHLQGLGLKAGDNVCVHSQLLSFGIITGGIEAVYEAFKNILGENGTLAVPTYRVEADPNDPYDIAHSPSINVGAFSEHVRKQPGAVRSACPMHNHTAIGPLAEILSKPDGHTSMGSGSDFEQLVNHDFKTVYLGCTFPEAATFVFHIQAMHGQLPYRKWLELDRSMMKDDAKLPFKVNYYGRKSFDVTENLDKARHCLEEKGYVSSQACPYSSSFAVSLGDYFEQVLAELKNDPLFFVDRA